MLLSSSSTPMAEPDTVVTPSHHKQFSDVGLSPSSPTRQNPCKFVTRAAFFVAFAALLPLLPSQAPEFVSQTLLSGGWELLHLLLVGVAVSYGLFSRRNADPASEKEALLHKAADSPQSYLTQLLQVSPVFDDDETPEIQPGAEGGKLQMWNSRYHREEPTVVVAGEISGDGGGDVDRPLLLPVRSLRSRNPDTESPPVGKSKGPEVHAVADVRSRALPRGGAKEGKVGEAVSVDPMEQLGDRVVLPSPIPWRSRSGRMEVKDEIIGAAKQTDARSFRSAPFHSHPSRPSSAASSPRTVSPSPPVSPERRAKSGGDSVKKKTLYKPPPPPPPPPPPTFSYKPPILPSNGKTSQRSFQDELQGGSDDRGRNSDVGSLRSSTLRTGSRHHAESYCPGRSVRTVRSMEALPDSETEGGATTRPEPNPFLAAATGGISPSPVAPARVHQTQKNNGYVDEVVVASDESDSSDDADEGSDVGELSSAAATAEAEENEVDKKADEFIAKFREQIRLQRIESIKTSAGQRGLRGPGK